MFRSLRSFSPLLALPFACLLPAVAHANVISGTVYCNLSSNEASNTTTPGSAPTTGTLCATFQTSDINFTNSNGGQNTVGQFLNSTGLIIGGINYTNGFSASSNLDDSLLTFTGSAYFNNGQTYYATHDDGTVMQVNGVIVINAPSPTAARTDTFTFNGQSGMYNFAYNFSEVQGASIYKTNAAATPEPASAALLGSGLLSGVTLLRRRRQLPAQS